MNWGKKILVLYLGFVGLIVTLVVTCFGNKTELEYADYYSRELKFQDQIDAMQNAADLEEPISHKVQGRELRISIPSGLRTADLRGTIHLLCPSSAARDTTIALLPGTDGVQLVHMNGTGVYKMRATVQSGGKNYFHESVLRFR